MFRFYRLYDMSSSLGFQFYRLHDIYTSRHYLILMGKIRKRTIYIDTDLDKEFAKAAIDAEVAYSNLAEDVLRSYLQTLKKKGTKS
jgi:hypothetical protein